MEPDDSVEEAVEYALSLQAQRPFDWRSIAFDKQIAFISDPHRLKASFTTRRGAKSYTDGIYLLKEAEETASCNCLYLGLTRLSAKGIIWKDVLKDINGRMDLGVTFNETELTATTRNGSVIYCAGVDVDEDERKKLFGRKYKLVVIDEAALYGIDLRDLCYVVIRPALTDLGGTLVLSGMSSNITRGLFYDITTGKEQGWSVHKWSAHDNPHVAKQWAEELEFIRLYQPALMQSARFRQAYLNEWVVDEEKLVYRFNETRNTFTELPKVSTSGWTYILGVDLGWEDDNAFVLAGFHENLPELYVIRTFNKPKLTFDQVVVKIQEFMNDKQYPPCKVIIDGANKQGVESMRIRSAIPFEFADKQGKVDFIEMLNGDFVQSKVKIFSGCTTLIEELKTLIWKMDGESIVLPKKEEPRLPNHLCFVAGTMIETINGPMPIETLTLGTRVLTRSGYRSITRCGTSGNALTLRLEMSDGRIIVCTEDHPFYTHNRGFVCAKDLTPTDRLFSLMDMSSIAIPNRTGDQIEPTSTAPLIKKEQVSMSMCGIDIMAPYLVDGTFTIKMEIATITTSQTLKRYPPRIISECMTPIRDLFQKRICPTWLRYGHLPKLGTLLQRAGNGIQNMLARLSTQEGQPKLMPITPVSVGLREWITNADHAPSAAKISPPINIPNKDAALCLVRREIGTKSTVYNLEVDEAHEYFANGLLVSNCDALLYAWRNGYHYHSEPLKKTLVVGSREWYVEQQNGIWDREREQLERQSSIGNGWPSESWEWPNQ